VVTLTRSNILKLFSLLRTVLRCSSFSLSQRLSSRMNCSAVALTQNDACVSVARCIVIEIFSLHQLYRNRDHRGPCSTMTSKGVQVVSSSPLTMIQLHDQLGISAVICVYKGVGKLSPTHVTFFPQGSDIPVNCSTTKNATILPNINPGVEGIYISLHISPHFGLQWRQPASIFLTAHFLITFITVNQLCRPM